MKLRRSSCFALLLAALLAAVLCGCSGRPAPKRAAAARDSVMIYCWGEHMVYNGYAAYVQSQFPDADVVFVVGRNSMSYYEFMEENNALPDILTVRRMSMIDAEQLRDSLLDLSETEAAASFNNVYLANYRFDDGTINWLPACGEVDGYIVNLDLFERYGIPLPTDRASFDAACEAFKAVGIQPYSNDYGKDYTCLQTLQGLSIQELMTADGTLWRMGYESGTQRQLDSQIWPAAFERLERQLDIWDVQPEQADYGFWEMLPPFEEGRAAMMRGTGNDVIALNGKGMHVGMLPYFGDTPEDSWLLTYPSFNVAVSKAVSEDPEHEALCLKVLEVMFSEEAQSILAGSHNVIPYNMGVNLDLDESMKNLEPYVKNNHLYLRLASSEIFNASLESVRGMIQGRYDARQAYARFNELLGQDRQEQEPPVVHLDRAYSRVFDPERGNEAASAMTNTLREYFGSDIVVAHGISYSGIVYDADYTLQQLKYMVTDTTVYSYTKQLTGAELRMMLEALLTREFNSDYGNMGMLNRYFLPVLSGCEMELTQEAGGYRLTALTRDGREIRDEDTFTVTYLASFHTGDPMLSELWADQGGLEAWSYNKDVTVQDHWVNCILGSDQNDPIPLAEPTDYIYIRGEA